MIGLRNLISGLRRKQARDRWTTWSEYIINILMPTSIHIPKALLVAVDKRAHVLRLSRNRLIVQALEREVADDSQWSPGFFTRLGDQPAGVGTAVDEMSDQIRQARTSKPPRRW